MSNATSETAPKAIPGFMSKAASKAAPAMSVALAGACLSIPIGLAFLALHPTPTFADSYPTLTLEIIGDTAPDPLRPSTTAKSSSNLTRTIKATMNNTGTYTLTATPSSTNLTDPTHTTNTTGCGTNNPDCQQTITPATANSTLSDMTNQWGYRIKSTGTTIPSDPVFNDSTDKYNPLSSETQLYQHANANYTTETTEYAYIDFGATVDSRIAAGNYQNTITISALATPITTETFTINYLLNDGSGTTYQTDTTTLNPTGGNYTIPNTITNPTRSGYTFVGWDTTSSGSGQYQIGSTIPITTTPTNLYAIWEAHAITITYNLNGGSGCDTVTENTTAGYNFTPSVCTSPTKSGKVFAGWGTTSSATTTISFPQAYNADTTLYAVWRNRATTFQTFEQNDCDTINFGQTINLTDARDNKSYLVTKLKMSASDTTGTCWMAQNLAIEPGATLTSSNSNVSSDYTILSGTGFMQPNGQYAIVPSHQNSTVDDATNNTGGLYSWGTATAGTFSSTYDICPKGWRLPTGNTGEFYSLYQAYGGSSTSGTNSELQKYFWGTAGTSATLSSVLVGSYYQGSASSAGNGYWWSSTPNGTDYRAYYMSVRSSDGVFSTREEAYGGPARSIRCVFDPYPSFQNFTASDCSALTDNEVVILTDTRGPGYKYRVTKLADGGCWMTQNLALQPGTILSSSDSSISGSYTIPSSVTKMTSTQTDGTYKNEEMVTGSHVDATIDNKSNNTGSYFSWYVATAKSGDETIGANQNAPYDICPKNWRLPAGGSTGEFQVLYNKYGSCDGLKTPWGIPTSDALVGYYYTSGLLSSGSNALWWSRTALSATYAYSMGADTSSFSPASNGNRYGGRSIRCVLASS